MFYPSKYEAFYMDVKYFSAEVNNWLRSSPYDYMCPYNFVIVYGANDENFIFRIGTFFFLSVPLH